MLDYSEACEQHSSVTEVMEEGGTSTRLSLADCLEHYTRAETLAMEDAWRYTCFVIFFYIYNTPLRL